MTSICSWMNYVLSVRAVHRTSVLVSKPVAWRATLLLLSALSGQEDRLHSVRSHSPVPGRTSQSGKVRVGSRWCPVCFAPAPESFLKMRRPLTSGPIYPLGRESLRPMKLLRDPRECFHFLLKSEENEYNNAYVIMIPVWNLFLSTPTQS